MMSSESVLVTRQLDPTLYELAGNETAFFKVKTGIEDDAALKNHILTIQEEAYKVFPYPCIRRFAFTRLKISRQPCYQQFLNLGKDRKGAIYADIGCCFGNDPRKAVADGYPVEQVIASDLHPEFWELGHRLFKSTAETFPARFIPADIFQLKGLTREGGIPVPELPKVQSLAELRGNISAIHTSSFFHLFDEERQYEVAKIMAALLSSEPGSMIFGSHAGRREKGLRTEVDSRSGRSNNMFCHSPESWRSLWDGEIFPKGTVRVDAVLHERERADILDPGVKLYLLIWCITVL
ncbi:uncharacterized protein EV420DRAFT_1298372 [Desarmillaria tabescens]|uniref:Methyltransferase domain-containing protein n=1 Tax=Armillaria tabescens TaxID=1929756 RepID=A0AA39NQK6_ARMTA|nr:uncharacterized protein EV420DRAFT_1298372 [Desarmillaria tabescens]KAK0469998.1 hypothetical protein EV420DRAFT_1298372 [Desarmillaria tabescens]